MDQAENSIEATKKTTKKDELQTNKRTKKKTSTSAVDGEKKVKR